MNVADIAFPHLGIYLTNVPKNFSVFGFTIALYGVVIALGMAAGVIMASCLAKKSNQDPDVYWDFALWAIIISVICARIYYVIFSWDNYKGDLLSILNLRNGGLAIYGGVIGAFSTLFVYCKIKKINPLLVGDTAVPGLILGQIIGRWGNFFNREAFGEYTDGIFAMRLPREAVRYWEITTTMNANSVDGTIQVSPTFLYEGGLNLIVFIIMLVYWKHRKFDGEICLLYLGGYGLVRVFVEGLRTDQLKLWGTDLAVSQLLSVALIVFAIAMDIVGRVKQNKNKKTEAEA